MNHLPIGGFNSVTGELEIPKFADKKNTYHCPCCKNPLTLCKGAIRTPYFRHKHDNNIRPCNYYDNPGESDIHRNGKLCFQQMLLNNINIIFLRKCSCCDTRFEYIIPPISENSNIIIEYSFNHNGIKRADIALLEGSEIIALFECCYKHKTSEESRPPHILWFEYDAEAVIRTANDITTKDVVINCIRNETCEGCIIKLEEERIKEQERKLKEEEYRINKEISGRIVQEKLLDMLKKNLETIENIPRIPVEQTYSLDDYIYIEVNFNSKDELKKLGGLWDKTNKLWYISKYNFWINEKYILEYIGKKVVWDDAVYDDLCKGLFVQSDKFLPIELNYTVEDLSEGRYSPKRIIPVFLKRFKSIEQASIELQINESDIFNSLKTDLTNIKPNDLIWRYADLKENFKRYNDLSNTDILKVMRGEIKISVSPKKRKIKLINNK
jgi:hypothetical protein